ncbi:MAG TPA: hypothetical protein VF384_09645 [Planctomycetota bacterium]
MNGMRWVLLVAAAVIVGGMVTSSLTAPPGDWTMVVDWARSRRAEIEAQCVPCPVLTGEPIAADAIAGYAVAARLARSATREGPERLRALLGDANAWPLTDGDRALLAALAPATSALREATRAVGATSTSWDEVELHDLATAAHATLVEAFAVPDVPALDRVLATLACGIDLACTGGLVAQFVGLQLVHDALAACSDTRLAAVSGEGLAAFLASLTAAERVLPVQSPLPAHIVVRGISWLESGVPIEPFELGMNSAAGAWRHGFSARRSAMARLAELAVEVQRFENEDRPDEAWATRQARLQALAAFDRARNSDLRVPLLPAIVEAEERRRGAVAGLRLLRLALAVQLGVELGPLVDPLSDAPLLVERHADRIVCRCPSGAQRTVARR